MASRFRPAPGWQVVLPQSQDLVFGQLGQVNGDEKTGHVWALCIWSRLRSILESARAWQVISTSDDCATLYGQVA